MIDLTDAEKLVKYLTEKGMTVTTAESCTGGLIASTLVDIPGASAVLREAYVTYAEASKEKLLGVKAGTIAAHTVVSSEVAKEMAAGAARAAGADAAMSVTGYAGPEDGEDGTPAGTVYIGTCVGEKLRVEKYLFSGNRRQVREQATEAALHQLLLLLLDDK